MLFFQFFKSPVALKNNKKFCLPQEKVEMTPLAHSRRLIFVRCNVMKLTFILSATLKSLLGGPMDCSEIVPNRHFITVLNK